MSDWDLEGVTLPGDLLWSDEFKWSATRQVHSNTITGALLIEQSAVLAGRPITLQSHGTYIAVVTRATVDALKALDVTPRSNMTLTSPDDPERVFTVQFRHADGVAIDADPIDFCSPVASTDLHTLTLRLIVVA